MKDTSDFITRSNEDDAVMKKIIKIFLYNKNSKGIQALPA